MKFKEYDKLDNSIDSFRLLKVRSEEHWSTISLDLCWGYQVQPGSKWNKGLTEQELLAFQNETGLEFPEALKNYFRVMNGLDKLGVSKSDDEDGLEYGPVFYSYPDDVETIKSAIYWVLKDNDVSQEDYQSGVVPKIFPYFGHRFLILTPEEVVLSMHGTDIILWADSLAKGIASDAIGFGIRLSGRIESIPNNFWVNKVQ